MLIEGQSKHIQRTDAAKSAQASCKKYENSHCTQTIENTPDKVTLSKKERKDNKGKLQSLVTKVLVVLATLTGFIGSPKAAAETQNQNGIKKELVQTKDSINNAKDTVISWKDATRIVKSTKKNISSPIQKFGQSLKNNKSNLMADLNIDSDTYNQYASVACKIAKTELAYKNHSSDFLQNNNMPEKVKNEIQTKIAQSNNKTSCCKFSEEGEALLAKYNVNTDSLSPEKEAIATMIKLAELGEGYSIYLENINKIKPDSMTIHSAQGQEAIQNAESIIFNNVSRPLALRALSEIDGSNNEAIALEDANLTQKDLDDLRFYATTIELSKDDYLLASWRNQNITPSGEKMDVTCKNLLNIVASKNLIPTINN